MSTNAATEAALAALHKSLADSFSDILNATDGEGKRVVPPAQVLNVIRQYLKDNGIEADRGHAKHLAALTEGLPFDGDEYSIPQNSH